MIDVPTFVAGLVASLIVALITFVLGFKSGKTQTDRQRLQELYKTLLVHFEDLGSHLDSNPRRWEQYEKKEQGWEIHYLPPARKMEYTGDSVYLNQKLFKDAIELECDVLKYAFDVDVFYGEFLDAVVGDEHLFTSPLEAVSSYNSYNNGNRHCFQTVSSGKYTKGKIGKLYDLLSPGFGDRILKLLSPDCYLSLEDSHNPREYELTITPDSYSNANELASSLEMISMDCPSYNELIRERKELKDRIEALSKKLVRRAKEPTTFWEAFFGAFADIFKR